MESDGDSTELVTVESGALIETRRGGGTVVPAIVAAAGDGAARRFLEFFAVTIDNPNTRAAYFHACQRFFAWCDRREDIDELVDIEPMHVVPISRRWPKITRSRASSSTSSLTIRAVRGAQAMADHASPRTTML